jgi:hypothetical protein
MTHESEGFDSLNSTVVIIDEPGDRTVRPCSPDLLPVLEAMREKLKRYGERSQENRGQSESPSEPGK